MSSFTFKSGVKTLDIKNAEGVSVKVYTVNVGQKEQTKKWLKQINEVKKVGSNLSEDESVIDELEAMEKNVVESVLDGEAWIFLWELCEENVLSMLGFVQHLSNFLKESMESFYKDYV